MESNKRISDVREYFRNKYSYVNLGELTDVFILKYLEQPHIIGLSFEMKMNYLYDYILSNDLTDVTL